MVPPKIVLLIGNRGENVRSIQKTLSAHYQVVLFHKVEKEMSWFDPIAVILHQHKNSSYEVLKQVKQLKQIKPCAPLLLFRSEAEVVGNPPKPDGIEACLSWPGDFSRLKTLLYKWEQRPLSLKAPLLGAWQRLKQLFFPPAIEARQQPSIPEPPMTPTQDFCGLEASLFGAFELKMYGQPLPIIRSEVNRAMLAYLLYHSPGRMPRHKIIEGFWPDSNEEAARNCLNVAISSLRRYWRENWDQRLEVCFKENAYHLHIPVAFASDVQQFINLWERGKVLEKAKRADEALNVYRQACSLYTGDFLEGISRNIEWVESTRSKLREAYLSVLDRLCMLLMSRSLFQEAEKACHKMLEIDDCIESAHRHLMIIYYSTNRRNRALRQYRQCCLALQQKLAVEPFEETEILHKKILSGRL